MSHYLLLFVFSEFKNDSRVILYVSLRSVFLSAYQNMAIFLRNIERKRLGCKVRGTTEFTCISLSNLPSCFRKRHRRPSVDKKW